MVPLRPIGYRGEIMNQFSFANMQCSAVLRNEVVQPYRMSNWIQSIYNFQRRSGTNQLYYSSHNCTYS